MVLKIKKSGKLLDFCFLGFILRDERMLPFIQIFFSFFIFFLSVYDYQEIKSDGHDGQDLRLVQVD
jgi:hypothetical protein